MRFAGRRDRNHGAIVAALRTVGCTVLDLGNVGQGCPDLLVATPRGRTLLIEVKDGAKAKSKRALTPAQREFMATWRGEVCVAENEQQAVLQAMGLVTKGAQGT